MLATPLEEAGGILAPQGSLALRGQREKQVSLAKPAPQDSKEKRAPRVSRGKESWWITMATSARPSRRSAHWP